MFEKSEGFTLRTFAFCYLDIAFWFILEWNVYCAKSLSQGKKREDI